MLFDVAIDFNEYDLYTVELEQKLNQKMMDNQYVFKGRISTERDIILQYYRMFSIGNVLYEYTVSFTYYSRDLQTFILEKVELRKDTRESEIINISNREEIMKILPKDENLESLYELGELGGK
jgi:hypothetical protein